LLFITPLVNLPYIWQRILKHDPFEIPKDASAFAPALLVKNSAIFFKNLVDFNYILPYAGFLTIISILIFLYLFTGILRKKIHLQGFEQYFLVVLFISVSISTIMYLSYYYGDYTHPSMARFFIVLSIVFALGPVALKILKPNFPSGRVLLLFSIICFLFYHPIAVEGRFINTLKLNRRTEHCMNFLSALSDKNVLIISPRPGQYTALGHGAVNFDYANEHRKSLLNEANRHLYSKIIAFQQIMYESGEPTKDTVLHLEYRLDTQHEIQITATTFLRISEVLVEQTEQEH
jgi:hypothetical protein